MRMLLVTCLLISFVSPLRALAQQAKSLDDASEKALQETQALLGDQKQIQDFAKTNPDAAKANSNVQTMTGGNSEDSANVYRLASDIFGDMTKETGGDAAGMEKILANAMKNPQAFADKLSPRYFRMLWMTGQEATASS